MLSRTKFVKSQEKKKTKQPTHSSTIRPVLAYRFPTPGTYYIGVYGNSEDGNNEYELTLSYTCQDLCSENGVCNFETGACQCDSCYSGVSCQIGSAGVNCSPALLGLAVALPVIFCVCCFSLLVAWVFFFVQARQRKQKDLVVDPYLPKSKNQSKKTPKTTKEGHFELPEISYETTERSDDDKEASDSDEKDASNSIEKSDL